MAELRAAIGIQRMPDYGRAAESRPSAERETRARAIAPGVAQSETQCLANAASGRDHVFHVCALGQHAGAHRVVLAGDRFGRLSGHRRRDFPAADRKGAVVPGMGHERDGSVFSFCRVMVRFRLTVLAAGQRSQPHADHVGDRLHHCGQRRARRRQQTPDHRRLRGPWSRVRPRAPARRRCAL